MIVPPSPAPPVPAQVRPAPGVPVTLRDGRVALDLQLRCPRGPRRVDLAAPTVRQQGDAATSTLGVRSLPCTPAWRTVRWVVRERPAGQTVRRLAPGPAVVDVRAFGGGGAAARRWWFTVQLRGPDVPPPALPAGVRWRYDPPGDFATVASGGDGLVVAIRRTSSGTLGRNALVGLDPDTGTPRWEVRLPGAPGRAVVATDGTAVVGTANGWVMAVGADGVRRWTRRVGFPVELPAVDTGVAVVAAEEPSISVEHTPPRRGQVVALDLADGVVRWRARSGDGDVYVAAADGAVILAPGAGRGLRLEQRDILTGAVRWRVPVRASWSTPALGGGSLYLDDGAVEARDVATGAVRWRTLTRGSDPTLVGDLVMSGQGYEEVALDAASGAVRWRASFGDNRVFPVLQDGRILVAMGGLWRLDPASGTAARDAVVQVSGPLAVTPETMVAGGVSVFGFPRPAG